MNQDIKDIISNNQNLDTFTYNSLIGGFILWGLFLSWFMVSFSNYALLAGSYYPKVFIACLGVSYFVFPVVGTFIFRRSERPLWSFIGYNLVIISFSCVLSTTSLQDGSIVKQALRMTIETTLIITLLALFFPKKINHAYWASFLCLMATLSVIGLEFLITGSLHSAAIMITIFTFSSYISYQWFKASCLTNNLDNAIDCAAAIYLDVIELFLRLLQLLMLNKKSDKEEKQ